MVARDGNDPFTAAVVRFLFFVVSTQEQYDAVLDDSTLGPLFSPGPDGLGLQKEYSFAGACRRERSS